MRRLASLLVAPLVLAGAAIPGAADADVVVKRVFAMPVDATPFTSVPPSAPGGTTVDQMNQRILCTPEPDNRREYLTHDPFSATAAYGGGSGIPGDAGYLASNVPSSADLTPSLQAGGSADLCFGFTLTPNMAPDLVRATTPSARPRLNDPDAPLADDPDTHVWEDIPADPDPGTKRVLVDGDDMRTVKVTMPTGFAGVPDDLPQCSSADFGADLYAPVAQACGPAVVGTAYVRLTTLLHNTAGSWQPGDAYLPPTVLARGGAPNPVGGIQGGGQVFNLTHGPGELARLGIMVWPANDIAPTKIIINLKLSADGRIQAIAEAPRRIVYRKDIDVTTKRPKNDAEIVPMYVEALGIRAFGAKDDHPTTNWTVSGTTYTSGLTKDFVQWGTNCDTDLKASLDLETYQGVKSSGESAPFRLTGCDSLDFRPSIDVTTTEQRPGVPTGTEVRITVGQNADGQPRTALLRTANVTLPKGLELGAQVASGAGGLRLCSAAEFAKDSTAPNTCPAASSAGTVQIKTPLIASDFVGEVYLGEQPAVGELPKLYLQAQVATPADYPNKADLPRIKLVGEVKANDDGTITASFKDAPQLRFSEIQITFPQGDHALFVTPRTCDPASATSSFTSWAGQTVERSTSIQMTEGCETPAFGPTISMAPADATAGASSPTTVTVSREDRSPWLKDVKVSLPTGFLADLNVPTECSASAAATGACPESSRIATVVTEAGAGSKPLSLTGAMYLVERQEGSVAGAAIVVRAKLGDLDLGDVVVPARIDLRPTDAGLTLTTTAPTRFKNLALLIRSIKVTLDREGFPLNPTACGPLRTTAQFGADTGASATATTDTTYTGCAQKPFQPQLKAEFIGDVKSGQRPTVRVQMTPRKGDTNLRSVNVLLPEGASAWTPNINGRQCANDAFVAGNCPAISKVGTVSATVAITPDRLVGDVFLVKVDGEILPGIGMSFSGRYSQRVLSRVKVDRATGRLLTAFEAIPDLPLTSLDLSIDGGTKGPIQFSDDVCKNPTSWDASLSGQGGQTAKIAIPFDCSAPDPKSSVSWSRKSGLTLTVSAPSSRALSSVRLTLPSGFKVVKTKSSLKKNVKVSASGGKAKARITSRTIAITASGDKVTKMKLTLKAAGLQLPASLRKKGLKKGTKLKLRTAIALSGQPAAAKSLTVKVR